MRHTLHKCVAELVILFARYQQMRAIARDDACVFDRAGLKIPCERCEEPGPAHHIAIMKCLDVNHAVTGAFGFQGHFPPIDEIEPVRRFALAKNDFARLELLFRRSAQKNFDMPRVHIDEEWML